MESQDKILELYMSTGALLNGHFILSSGKHSSVYLQSAKVLCIPKYLKFIGQELSNNIKKKIEIRNLDLIVSPAMGGIIIGSKVGEYLNIKSIFLERVEGKLELRRGFEIQGNSNVLVVEDVVTSGKSSIECINCIEKNGGKVVGLASIVNRSIKPLQFDFPFISLLKIDAPIYDKQNVPKEIAQLPVSKPGSRGLK